MTTHNGLDDEELLVHNWGWTGSPGSASPDRWPRATTTASTGTQIACRFTCGYPRGWPCASPSDETRPVRPAPDWMLRWWATGPARVAVASTAL